MKDEDVTPAEPMKIHVGVFPIDPTTVHEVLITKKSIKILLKERMEDGSHASLEITPIAMNFAPLEAQAEKLREVVRVLQGLSDK